MVGPKGVKAVLPSFQAVVAREGEGGEGKRKGGEKKEEEGDQEGESVSRL